MNKSDIQLLYEYDRWANDRVFRAASALTPEQFTRDLGGSFRSVRDTLVHILGGEWVWLAYWKYPPGNPADLENLKQRRQDQFHPDAFPSVAEVKAKWAEIEGQQSEFVERLTDESLGKRIPFRDAEFPLAHLMQHLANHSTYHRGQIALMLRQLGAQPLPTDFHVFLAEGRGQAVAGSQT